MADKHKPSNNQENQKQEKRLNPYIRFTSVAFQMGATIYLGNLLGKWLDGKYNDGDKGFIVIMTLLGVGLSIYTVVKQLNRIKY